MNKYIIYLQHCSFVGEGQLGCGVMNKPSADAGEGDEEHRPEKALPLQEKRLLGARASLEPRPLPLSPKSIISRGLITVEHMGC